MSSVAAAILPDSLIANQWEIVPRGLFSRHYDLFRDGEVVVSLQMAMFREACEFTIAGHDFAIRHTSVWKDTFQLLIGDKSVCEVKRAFWSRRFELAAIDQSWVLQRPGFLSRGYQLISGENEVGTIRPAGWFTRRRFANFVEDVPPPVQVLAIFLVLIVSQRQHRHSSGGGGVG
ncbi:MAG TPA: hypothetical protein VGM76_01895 [Lacipirellulaceae bacterium]|jgi:hypothetical protein